MKIPYVNLELTGSNIESLRKKSGMSVKDMQEIFGFATPQAIYKWQHGDSIPEINNLLLLAEIFDCNIEDILVCEYVNAS